MQFLGVIRYLLEGYMKTFRIKIPVTIEEVGSNAIPAIQFVELECPLCPESWDTKMIGEVFANDLLTLLRLSTKDHLPRS